MDESRPPSSSPADAVASSFKGLALFTPGGDCVYCCDRHKQAHWHLDLCAALQRALDLREPPYFLLPCYTATVDRWFDRQRQTWVTLAEAYPRVLCYQTLLNVLFDLDDLAWQPNYTPTEACAQTVIESYRPVFPQLWQSHDLILPVAAVPRTTSPAMAAPTTGGPPLSYGFQLFVSGADTTATEQLLRVLHQTLEAALPNPYSLQLIDVLSHPDLAEREHITATPTLVRVSPLPSRRLVGHLPNPQQIRDLLGQEWPDLSVL